VRPLAKCERHGANMCLRTVYTVYVYGTLNCVGSEVS
jgi:hypothetical protein